MGRGLRLQGVLLVVAVGLTGAASPQDRGPDPPVLGAPATPVRTGVVDMDKAVEWELLLGPSFRDEITRRVPKPPKRLPELPLPKEFEAPPLPEAVLAPSELETPLSPLPLPSTSFASLGDPNTSIPPDTHGAVGPTKLITTLNTHVLHQHRDGSIASGPTSIGNFWTGVATASVFDPRVSFDPDRSWSVWSIPAASGVGGYSLRVGGSAIKGFLFPDRSGGDVFAATSSEVVGVTDNGAALVQKAWSPLSLSAPSIVLLKPGSTSLYAGVSSYSGNASLLRIDTATGNVAAVALEPSAQIVGAPSLDIGFAPNMIYVGSVSGVLYAVEASF